MRDQAAETSRLRMLECIMGVRVRLEMSTLHEQLLLAHSMLAGILSSLPELQSAIASCRVQTSGQVYAATWHSGHALLVERGPEQHWLG